MPEPLRPVPDVPLLPNPQPGDWLLGTSDPEGTPETVNIAIDTLPVKTLLETSGPTLLDIGAIADGQALVRSGDMIVGGSAGGAVWSPADPMTYASSTTVTIAGDVVAQYPRGTKIRLEQSGTKYFNVINAVFSSPNTTLTLFAGSDFTVANAPIDSPSISYVETPPGFPYWFNWAPSYSASGSMTYTSVTTQQALCRIEGSQILVILFSTGTLGGTPSTTIISSAPLGNLIAIPFPGVAIAQDPTEFSGALVNGYCFALNNNINIRRPLGDAFTLGSNAVFRAVIKFPYS